MFEVLVYVYENYWRGDACPEAPQLSRKLSAAGFDSSEIQDALQWLDGLQLGARCTQITTNPPATFPDASSTHASLRVYSVAEQQHLGASNLGFVMFLESAGVLPPQLRELVLDRAMAIPDEPITLDDLKIIVLMVYWSLGTEPDALILDELCDDTEHRCAH